MRILLVGNYPPPFGGISVHVQLLHRLMLRQGIDCKALNIDPYARSGEEYISIGNRADFILRLISSSKGRIVHLHTNGHNLKSWLIAAASAWAGRLLGRGSVLTIHSGMSPQYIEKNSSWNKLLIKLALAPQYLVVCVNESIRSALISSGINPNKTLVMPAFLFDEEEPVPINYGLKQKLSKFTPILSATAFFRPEYGIELLINALCILKRQFPGIGCAVMGSVEGGERIFQLAVELGVADRILWLGELDHSECLNVMKNSDLFVRPTLADGDSISVREAVQLGVSVVASDVGHRPDSVLLFRPGDAVDLASKCSAALSTRASVIRQSRSYSSDSLLNLLNVYESLYRTKIETYELRREKL